MVIAVLAALMAISAPFVFSMIQHGRSARNDTSQQTAREGAEGATAHALTHLLRTARSDFTDTSPEITSARDLLVSMKFNIPDDKVKRFGLDFDVQNPRGLLWSARIEDEQGKVNVNSAPPALLGNLLASGILIESTGSGETLVQLDDASQFARGGGLIYIEGEPQPVPYSAVSSGSSGGSLTLEQGLRYAHQKGALVYDGRARLVANGVFANPQHKFLPYHSIYEIKMADGLSGTAAITPEAFAKIERHITVENGLGNPLWGRGERLGDGASGAGDTYTFKNAQGFSPGTLMRSEFGGVAIGFARVRETRVNPDGSGMVLLDNALGAQANATPPKPKVKKPAKKPGEEKSDDQTGAPEVAPDFAANAPVFIEPQMKHPVNLNTASDEVLAAVFTGVCLRGRSEAVNRRAAEALVDFLRGRLRGEGSAERPVYATNDDFRKKLYRAFDANIISLPQRDALIINASEPNSSKLRISTVPFCYFSHGNYTIEGSGVANSDTGMQQARHTIRQQLSIPTALPGRFMIQYQEGFQQLLDQGLGERVVTFPEILGHHRFVKDAPLARYGKVDVGNVRLSVGESASIMGKSTIASEPLFDHCDTESEPGYMQEGYNMGKRQPYILAPGGGGGFGGVHTPPTSIELWYRPQGGGQCTFYDEGTENERNRVTFSYDPGSSGLSIKIWDAAATHRTRHPVEFVYPISFNAGDWYHIAASWKTSHPGGQEIRVDAKPFPGTDPTQLQFKPGGRLGTALGLDDGGPTMNLSLEDGDGEDFPKAGAIKIGEEIIEYTDHSGTQFSGLYRGARMSAVAKHKSGEWVIPFGYVNFTRETLNIGKGKLVEDLNTEQLTNAAKIQLPPPVNPKQPWVLDSETAKIPVDDLTDYPSSGFVLIAGECIYYGAKAKVKNSWELQKIQRAQSSAGVTAPARNLRQGAPVRLCSVLASVTDQYNGEGLIQIEDDKNHNKVEWLHYQDKKDVDGKHYFVARLWNPQPPGGYQIGPAPPKTINGGQNVDFWAPDGKSFRHSFGIGGNKYLYLGVSSTPDTSTTPPPTNNLPSSSHSKSEKIIPVIHMLAPHCGGYDPKLNHDSPYGDGGISEVTVVQLGQRDGDLLWVKQAYMNQYQNYDPFCHFTGWGYDFYAGLNDFTTRMYPANDTRFLRWPTGELPDAVNARRYVLADKNGEGKVNGDVDEVRVNTLNSLAARVAMTLDGTGLDSGEESILIENYDAWPQPGGNTPQGVTSRNVGGAIVTTNNNNGGGSNAATTLHWPTEGGLARIEDELIYYTTIGSANVSYFADVYPMLKDKPPHFNKDDHLSINPCTKDYDPASKGRNIFQKSVARLTNVQRGVLGTQAKDHPVGAQIMLLDAMAVSHLTAPYSGMNDGFGVADGHGFPMEGYAWINDEVVSWKMNNGNSFSGTRFLRGRFGTAQGDHIKGDIVRCLPFRFWDRNVDEYDSDGIAFIQSGYYADGARWYGVDLDLTGTETVPMRPANVQPHILARFNGAPGWDSPPTNTEGGLFEFKNVKTGKGVRFRGAEGNNVRADQLEVRVFWQYLPGAFKNAMGLDWKRTFSIERMRGIYTSPLVMRRLDEVEKR